MNLDILMYIVLYLTTGGVIAECSIDDFKNNGINDIEFDEYRKTFSDEFICRVFYVITMIAWPLWLIGKIRQILNF